MFKHCNAIILINVLFNVLFIIYYVHFGEFAISLYACSYNDNKVSILFYNA